MSESVPSDLLARYLTGAATPEEQLRVQAWAASAPEHQAELERMRQLWTAAPAGDWNVDRAWNRVSARLDRPSRTPWSRTLLPLAAAVTLVLGGLMAWRLSSPTSAADLPDEVATGPGERRVIALPDGSEITLAPLSRLRVAGGYGRGERRVELQGEGWFVVTHDANRPFRVHAGGTVTEDLGTEFSVRTLTGDAGVRVVLVSGSASLRRSDAPESAAVILRPSDVAVLPPGNAEPHVTSDPTAETLVSWRRDSVTFHDARMDSVVTELARWYPTPVTLGDPVLAGRRFTGTLPLADLDETLEILALSLAVRVDRQERAVVLRANR